MQPAQPGKRHDSLSMRIYSAFLGGKPKVRTPAPTHTRLKMHLRLETEVTRETDSPFRAITLRQTIERAAAGAMSALSDASERLRRSRDSIHRTPSTPQATRTPSAESSTATSSDTTGQKPKPVVLIGPGVRRAAKVNQDSRTAA